MSTGDLAAAVALINRYMDEGYTDGLPVVPPTRESVAAMIAAAGRPGDHVLGAVTPAGKAATIEAVAINAVMAGCLPAYMPVVVAALEALLDPGFVLNSVACTTKGVTPLVIINGPIRQRLGINCRGNLFGHGFRANATIGRALRLILINLGGARSQVLDRSTFGHPGKYTYVIGEDEEGSPWSPFHVEHGFRPEESTVAVVACEGPRQVNNHHHRAGARELLLTIADAMSSLDRFTGPEGTDAVVLIGGEHRAAMAAAGWTKEQVRAFLYTHSRRRAGELAGVGSEQYGPDDDRRLPLFGRPDKIKIISAGGGGGRFSAVCHGFAADRFSRWQIRRIPDEKGGAGV